VDRWTVWPTWSAEVGNANSDEELNISPSFSYRAAVRDPGFQLYVGIYSFMITRFLVGGPGSDGVIPKMFPESEFHGF
jgi:hypothetical protein